MPELPEVETIVRGLNKKIVGRKIVDIWTDWPKYFRFSKKSAQSLSRGNFHEAEKDFRKHAIGKKIIQVKRRAKNVLIYLSDNHLLLIHQKMSGHLIFGSWQEVRKTKQKDKPQLPEKWLAQKWIPIAKEESPLWDPMNRFIRLIFFFGGKEVLALSDLRRFAKVLCAPKEVILNLPEFKGLGPEPLDPKFTFSKFRRMVKGFFVKEKQNSLALSKARKGKIKPLLLDQGFISGIGNIYADEILWFSKINPLTRIESLKEKKLKELYNAIKTILKKAIRLRGSSVDDYRDALGRRGTYDLTRYVYQRENEPCYRCGEKIKRIKIAQRSSHFCPGCQKL